MDQRLFFVLGDLFSNVAGGAIIGGLVWLLTPQGWNMWLAMLLAMALGMVLATLLWLPFGVYFGAMEVMVPLMLTGMVAGMIVGMRTTMGSVDGGQSLLEGAVCGLACIVAVWIANNSLRGVQPLRGTQTATGEDSRHG